MPLTRFLSSYSCPDILCNWVRMPHSHGMLQKSRFVWQYKYLYCFSVLPITPPAPTLGWHFSRDSMQISIAGAVSRGMLSPHTHTQTHTAPARDMQYMSIRGVSLILISSPKPAAAYTSHSQLLKHVHACKTGTVEKWLTDMTAQAPNVNTQTRFCFVLFFLSINDWPRTTERVDWKAQDK